MSKTNCSKRVKRRRGRSYSVDLRHYDSIYQDKPRASKGVTLSEFTTCLKDRRKKGLAVYFDQYGRCYIPAPRTWLRELNVDEDADVQDLKLKVMLINTESKATSPSVVSEPKAIPIPGDRVALRNLPSSRTKLSSRYASNPTFSTAECPKEMSVFSVHGRSRSRCFIVYLQDVSD
jgi:hypothetical protein